MTQLLYSPFMFGELHLAWIVATCAGHMEICGVGVRKRLKGGGRSCVWIWVC